jgi:hypothetical protein
MSEKMNARRAVQLVGDQPMWAIRNMVKALSSLSLLNSAEENERLEAAKWAIANQREFSIAASKRKR